jgi:hypothetical protein
LVGVALLVAGVLSGAVCACARSEASGDAATTVGDAGAAPARDAADEAASPDARARAEPRGDRGLIGAMNLQTTVLAVRAWPETGAVRLGYLRHGAKVLAYTTPTPNDECPEGWYELVEGGFVCGRAATTDLTEPRVRLAPRQPDRDAGMPYRYGFNLGDGTPLYRRVVGFEDRKQTEPWLAPTKPVEADEAEKDELAEEERASKRGSSDAGADAGKPKLKDFKGRGNVVRTMARGFYLALDRDFKAAGAHWWRTTFGFAVPFERIALQQGVTKHTGAWFAPALAGADAGANALMDAGAPPPALAAADGGAGPTVDAAAQAPATIVFVTASAAHKLDIDADGAKVTWGAELPRRSAALLNGRTVTIGGATYHQTSEAWWLRTSDVKLARPAPPFDLRPGEKWIDVDLTRQALVAFEGDRPVFATLVSSGRRNPQDKEKDFPTPTGTFRIREKHVTATMDGDVASDGPYSIEDVPWVMYFQGSIALHGAFWHDAFGAPRSHGCVNLAPDDARTLFGWVDPPLPEGWHGVFATDRRPGTRVVVHEDPPDRSARRPK